EGRAQLAPEDPPEHPKGVGLEATAGEAPARRAEHTALLEVEGGEGPFVIAATRAAVEHRVEALEGEQLPEERRAHERGGVGGECAQCADERPVERRVGRAPL